jgi:hypothetical protein
MNIDFESLHAPQRTLLDTIALATEADSRFRAVLVAGSVATNRTDRHSDLDIVLVCEPDVWPAVLGERRALAEQYGDLLAAFTGEHVGEARLLICLYAVPGNQGQRHLVHVDLKFVLAADAVKRVDEVALLWSRDEALAAQLAAAPARYPAPDPQWIEDRFWIWTHYGASKLARGELLEAIDFLAFLRARVFGPLILQAVGAQPNGVRRIEHLAAEWVPALTATLALHSVASVRAALEAAVALYVKLRAGMSPPPIARSRAELAARAYLAEVGVGRG